MSALTSDTHSAIWFLSKSSNLSHLARQAMREATKNAEPIYVSAISLIEMTYLIEKNRLPRTDLSDLLKALRNKSGNFRLVSINLAITRALRRVPRADVPDMPDRIIAATALHLGLPLITRDSKIRAASLTTIW